MLTVLAIILLLYGACAMLYQADARRSAFAELRISARLRMLVRAGACALLVMTLFLVSGLQGWERGIPIWLCLFIAAFLGGLFLSTQKPGWHAPIAAASLCLGAVATVGGFL
jgi:hypothetical protein